MNRPSGIQVFGSHVTELDPDPAMLTFRSTRMREIRDEARRLAVEDARAKAGVYASIAGVRAGRLLHIEDVDIEGASVDVSTCVSSADSTHQGCSLTEGAGMTVTATVLACFAIVPCV